jgi:F-type H+-transporting ATPase subunit b
MTRRTRLIAWALGLGIAAGIFTASPATAQEEETIGLCVFEKLVELEQSGSSIEALEEEGGEALVSFEKTLEKCVEAPSPIIPEIDEIIWGGSAFLLLFGFMVWKGFPAVQGAMDARAEKIAADLDAADQAKTDAVRIKSDHESELAGAKAEAGRIIDEARAQADQVKVDLQARANEEVAEIRARAAADAEAARAQALADLRGDVSEIAIGAAERVIRSNLDHSTQAALVDAYIDEVAGRG